MYTEFADQARELRKLSESETKVICISGGKGGVGKSIISVNMSVELAKRGKKVLIFDSDAGFANASILLGKTLKTTLSDYINNRNTIEECIQATDFGVNIISTGFDFKDWKTFQSSFSNRMFEDIYAISKKHDYLIVDIGAGFSENLKPFYLAADKTLIVTMPEPTAVVNAYTLIKALSIIGYSGELGIVLNMIRDKSEIISVEQVLRKTVNNFLNKDIQNFYYVMYDENVHDSVRKQNPVILKDNAKISKNIKEIVNGLIENEENDIESKQTLRSKIMKIFGLRN